MTRVLEALVLAPLDDGDGAALDEQAPRPAESRPAAAVIAKSLWWLSFFRIIAAFPVVEGSVSPLVWNVT
jgi:hypothetical protein